MNEVLDIKTTKEKFFLEYLTLKKPLIEFIVSSMLGKHTKVPDKLLNVLALLLYYNDQYKELTEEERWKTIFHKDKRKEYIENLNITDSQLNTYFSMLRNYKILNGKSINKLFIIHPDNKYELTFKFSLNGEK